MKNLILFLGLIFSWVAYGQNVKISELPSGNAATASTNDVFPYVDSVTVTTKKMRLYDLINLPAFVSNYASLTGPTFTNGIFLKDSSTNNTVQLVAPVLTGSYSFCFPLGVGSAGQVLTSDGTCTFWGAGGSSLSLGTPITGANSDRLLYSDASAELNQLPSGTAGQILQSNGAGAAPSWVNNSGGFITGVTDTPTIDLTVSSGNLSADIVAGSITDTQVSNSAAIAGTKIDPDFGSQNIVTTGDVSSSTATVSDDITLIATEFDNTLVGKKLVQIGSTGLLTGGVLSIDTDPTKFDLSAGTGVVIDYTVNPATIVNVSWSAFNAQTVTGLAGQDQTYILINSSGAIVQQSSFPTPQQRRENIFVGRLSHSSRTTIGTALSQPDYIQSVASNLYDLIDALGPFNISGNVISANGANMKLNKTSGKVFTRGANYQNNAEDPHLLSQSSGTAFSFGYNTQSSSVPGSVSDVDVTNYDVGGVVTAIGGGTHRSTIQRVYLFPTGQVRILYGQTAYSTFNEALEAVNSEVFIPNQILADNAILIAYIVATRTNTSLQNTSTSRIIPAGKFGTVSGGGGGGGGTLQDAYDLSNPAEITLNSTNGGVTVRDNATPITGNLFSITDFAASDDYFAIDTEMTFIGKRLAVGNFLNTQSGSAVTLSEPTTTAVELTNGSLVSVAGITEPAGAFVTDYLLTLTNRTGVSVTILNESGSATAANRILTGTGESFILQDNASVILKYSTNEARWMVVSAPAQNAGYTANNDVTLTNGDTIAIGTTQADKLQHWRVSGSVSPVTLSATPFGTTNPQDRTLICLMGTNDTNTVTITMTDAADGAVGNGDVTLGKFQSACFRYLQSEDRYVLESKGF